PVELARAAARAGLVANPYAAYLVLPTGEIRGVVKPVAGSELSFISTPPSSASRQVPALPDVAAAAEEPPADAAIAAEASPDGAAAAAGGEAGQPVEDEAGQPAEEVQ
ncbi:MAG: hypothetical protein LBI84_08840, partial [Propionibacteriaceae bacterium]|nr:hypothetical protein [Propionibacteriaceae bacterium]